MTRHQDNTRSAGVDVAKAHLDLVIHAHPAPPLRVPNTPQGWADLLAHCRAHQVARLGVEASGGYERGLVGEARREGLAVVVHQPAEIRAWARLTRTRAKTDRIDAALIAAATARLESLKAVQAGGERLAELAERLAAYEQVADEVARLKTFRDRLTLPDLKAGHAARIRALEQVKRAMLQALVAVVKACPELGPRWRLLLSLPGVGPLVAASLVVRMPELGGMRRGQAASLLGVAPFARDSGTWSGRRFVQGGRARPRRLLYLAAVNARRADAGLRAFSEGLLARGKPPKVALVALMRKLIEAANLVLARNTPWAPAQPK